ncbi:MAG: thioredoxin family protein [Candidatus Accumulibacter sp.]|jgi:thiol-disulfide isomerase/thioredoxin|nr:thioredoxin family protein [Accumulibacter sp.]
MSVHESEGARASSADLAVVCLCAQWCGTCREYRGGFERLAGRFPGVAFLWRDIEENAASLGDLDIEDFPTILVARGESVLFFGPMLPQAAQLRRLIETFREQTPEQSRAYALSTPDRQAWQTNPDLAALAYEALLTTESTEKGKTLNH